MDKQNKNEVSNSIEEFNNVLEMVKSTISLLQLLIMNWMKIKWNLKFPSAKVNTMTCIAWNSKIYWIEMMLIIHYHDLVSIETNQFNLFIWYKLQ